MQDGEIRYQNYLKEVEDFLTKIPHIEVSKPEIFILVVSDRVKNHSPLSLNYELDELKIGVGNVLEYYEDKFMEKGIWRFLSILTQKIRRTDFYKGRICYKSVFEIINDENKSEQFGTSSMWYYPFWKNDSHHTIIQNEILTKEDVEKNFNDIKVAAYEN